MQRIASVEPATATGKAKDLLDAVKGALGIVPNITKVMANQPAVLEAYLGFSQALGGGSFDAKTREAFALATAGANSCGYCASAHTAISKGMKVEDAEIQQNLAGKSGNAKLNAGLQFARAMVAKRGLVDGNDLKAVRDAGYNDAEITEIVGTVVLNIFTNYINHVADTDIDFPVVDAKAHAA